MKPMPPDMERGLYAEACRKSFWFFLLYGFGARSYCRAHPDEGWLTERVHRPLADWLQAIANEWLEKRLSLREPIHVLVLIPRGFGKTTMITEAFSMWLQLQDLDIAEAISSHGIRKAITFLGVIQRIWGGAAGHSWWPLLFGNWVPKNDPDREWRKDSFVHAKRRDLERKDPSFEAASVATGVTGIHPDVVIVDDPIVEEKLMEEGNWLDRVDSHLAAFTPAMKTNGLMLMVMTRYRDADCAGKAMRNDGVLEFAPTGMRPRTGDYVIRDDGKWRVYFLRAMDDAGEPILPEVWTKKRLEQYRRTKPIEFASQMMNEPGEGSHQPLKRELIEKLWVMPEHVPKNIRISIHTDTAFKTFQTAGRGDYSAIQVWGHAVDGSGLVYYLEGKRSNEWSGKDFLTYLVVLLQKLEAAYMWPFVITGDRVTGGYEGTFEDTLRNACARVGLPAPAYMPINRSGRNKSTRIRESAIFWQQGKVRLVFGAHDVEHLLHEMLRIDVSAHDDMADAACGAFHPDVYMPDTRRSSARDPQPPLPSRPYDDELQGNARFWDEAGPEEEPKEEKEAFWRN